MKHYTRGLISNSTWNLLRYAVSVLIMLGLTPIILHRIGVAQYGIWTLILAFSSTPMMLDFGFGFALNKFIPAHHARGETAGMNRAINVSLLIFCLIGVCTVAVLAALAPWVMKLFLKPAPGELSEVRLVYFLSLAVYWLNFMLAPLSSVLSGLQRFDLFAVVGISDNMLKGILVLLFFQAGWGLKGLAWAYFITAVLLIFMVLIMIRQVFPEYRPALPGWTGILEEAGRLFNFGSRIFITSLSGLLHLQLDKFLLGYFTDTTRVGYYHLGSAAARQVRAVPDHLIYPVYPLAAELASREETERLENLFKTTLKFTLMFIFPFFILVFIYSDLLVRLWLGEGFEKVALTLRYFLAAYFMNLLTAPGFHILNGMGRPETGMYSSILSLLLNLLLSPVLIWKFGFAGALWGTTLSLVVGAIYFCVLFHRHTAIPFLPVFRSCYLPPLLSSLAACAAYAAFSGFSRHLGCAVFLLAYTGLMAFQRPLSPGDRDAIKNLFRSRGR